MIEQPLREACREAMAELDVPGVAVGARVGDELVFFGEGVTSLAAPHPVTPETAFQIGSITKTFTATALMTLVEAGRVSLDDRVRTILPELRTPSRDIDEQLTLRDLLTHRTGWAGDVYLDFGRGEQALARVVATLRELDLELPFRRFVSYNNMNFCVVGRVLEVLTGLTYEDAVRTLVLDPCGMERSSFFLDELVRGPIAFGHLAGPQGIGVGLPFQTNRSWNPTGGLMSSVRDLIRYAETHLHGGGAISRETAESMREPQAPAIGLLSNVCLPWWNDTRRPVELFQHDGDTFSSQAMLTLVPERDAALAVLTNSNLGFGLIRRVLRAWDEVLEIGTPPVEVPLNDAFAQDQYVGRYRSRAHSWQVEAAGEDALLLTYELNAGVWPEFDPPAFELEPFRVAPVADDRFLVLDGWLKDGVVVFLRNDDGEVSWIHGFGRASPKRS